MNELTLDMYFGFKYWKDIDFYRPHDKLLYTQIRNTQIRNSSH